MKLGEKAQKDKKRLTTLNQKPIEEDKHNKLFSMPLPVFLEFPISSTFTESVEHPVVASKAATSQQFTFMKNKFTEV